MLAFTKKTDYALIALTHLAKVGPDLASARQIAEEFGAPLPLLTNILKTLHQQGLLLSVRGSKGGYQLACAPAEISIAGLIEAIEGPVALTRCADNSTESEAERCEIEAKCPVKSPLSEVRDRVEQLLSRITLAELVEDLESPVVAETTDEIANLPR